MSATQNENPIVFSDLILGQSHLELRTSPKFLHWDRAGCLWSEVSSRIPGLKYSEAAPNKTAFSLDRKYVFSTYMDTTNVPETRIQGSGHNPHKSLKEFSALLKIFVDIVQEKLEIDSYTRIGLRLIYHKNYSDVETATQAFLATNLIRVPEGSCFGIKGSPQLPAYSMRWEDGKLGTSIRFGVESFKHQLTPPIDWQDIEPVSKSHNRVFYDIDYYTIGAIATGQFNVIEWINQVLHVVNRDSDKFFRGT